MVIPTINTAILSFYNRDSTEFVGFANYKYFFTFPDTLLSLRNSLFWLVFFTGMSVFLGLVIAILADRAGYESIAKIAIFLPLPISAVAASVIWKFVFDYQPPGAVPTGSLNATLGT